MDVFEPRAFIGIVDGDIARSLLNEIHELKLWVSVALCDNLLIGLIKLHFCFFAELIYENLELFMRRSNFDWLFVVVY